MQKVLKQFGQILLNKSGLTLKNRQKFGQYSGKKYLTKIDVNPYSYIHLLDHLYGAYNCEMLSILLRDNLHILTDHHLEVGLYQLARHDIELDEHFYNVILPIVKEYVKNLDWEANLALGSIIRSIAYLRVEDDQIFEIFEKKLLDDNFFFYLSLDQIADIYLAFNRAGRGSANLFKALDNYIIKHRKAVLLDEGLMNVVHQAMIERGQDSQQVISLLENGPQYQQIQ